jgi:hypothetical protein
MSLHPDWLAILPKAIWAWTGRAHAFGEADCVVFVRDVLLAIGAKDPLSDGITWSTPRGAARVLRRVGGIATQLARVYPEIDLSGLRSGDVLALDACERVPMGCVWIASSDTAWTMQEGDARCAGGLAGIKLELLVSTIGLRAFDTGRAL